MNGRYQFVGLLGLCGLLATGCGAPELELVFDIPAPYGEQVQEVTLDIYEPRGAEAFDCEAVAFQTVDDGVLRATRVEQSVLREQFDVPLADIERTATKLFVATGYDATGVALVKGCAQIDVVDKNLSVTIPAEPVAEVVLVNSPSLSRTIGTPLDGPITLRVVDVQGTPLAGVALTWEIHGAGGVASTDQTLAQGVIRSKKTTRLTK